MFQEGEQIGAYTIRRRLGAGGMGEVYLAEHRHIDRKAAIKVLLPELSSNQAVVERFFNEARAASRIKHDGIVEIVDCDRHTDGSAYIVMEFLEGESLGESLRRVGRFDLSVAVGVVGQVADALAAAHAKGIIHRDLKPDNIFLAATPRSDPPIAVKVLDFGIAKLVGEEGYETRRTQSGALIGTPLYMSPEQCRGTGQIDPRADIYALGCILFELLAGRTPFTHAGAGELFVAHISEPAPDLGTLVSVPPAIAALVASMLAKAPGDRPASMEVVAHALAQAAGVEVTAFSRMVVHPEALSAWPVDAAASRATERRGEAGRSFPATLPTPASSGTRMLQDRSTTFSRTASEIERTRAGRPARAKLGLLAAVLGGAVAAGTTVFFALHSGAPEGGGHVVIAAPAPVARESEPASVDLHVSSVPAGELWLPGDREARGRTPLVVRLRVDAGRTEALLKAPPGFADQKVTLDPVSRESVDVTLARLPEAGRTARPGRVAREHGKARAPGASTRQRSDDYPLVPDNPTQRPAPSGAYPLMPDQ
jgi:serine/threonine protein kinase